jgi:hypothetical protein
MITPYPYLVSPAMDQHSVIDLAMSPKLAAFRNQIIEKILLQSGMKLVLVFGDIAKESFTAMLPIIPGQ